jgi:hypothetical protein
MRRFPLEVGIREVGGRSMIVTCVMKPNRRRVAFEAEGRRTMMIRRLLIGLAVAVCVWSSSDMYAADDSPQGEAKKGVNRSEEKKDGEAKANPTARAVTEMATADSLIKFGRKYRSPIALITAAEILGKIQSVPIDKPPTTKSDQAKSDEHGESKKGFVETNAPASLLAEAKKMSSNDTHVIAIADRVATSLDEKPKGRSPGPFRGVYVIPGHSSQTFLWTFRGDETAVVALSGDGDSDLDLYVYDDDGDPIDSDTDYSDDCVTTWIPRWTGTFIVKVVNRGSVANAYAIGSN